MPRETSEPGTPPQGLQVLQDRYRASERFVCRVAGQHRSTHRHAGKDLDIEEAKLRHRLREIAAEHIRWGRRMAYRFQLNEALALLIEELNPGSP